MGEGVLERERRRSGSWNNGGGIGILGDERALGSLWSGEKGSSIRQRNIREMKDRVDEIGIKSIPRLFWKLEIISRGGGHHRAPGTPAERLRAG